MCRAIAVVAGVLALTLGIAAAQDARRLGRAARGPGRIRVYMKLDFDRGDIRFKAGGVVKVQLEDRPDHVISGKSMHVSRAREGGYFAGPRVATSVSGSRGLKIAYCVRAKGIPTLGMNFADRVSEDNTTPVSPPRLYDDQWMPVLLHVEDFRYNAGQPEDKVKAETQFRNLMFHGPEAKGTSGEFWLDKFIIYRGDDTQPPAPPADVKAKPLAKGKVELTWAEPPDDVFPVVYSIYRRRVGRWQKVGESLQPRYVDTAPAPGRYAYRITAADYENNSSGPSKDLVVSIVARGRVQKVTDDRVKDREAYAANIRKIHAAGAGKVRRDVLLFFGDSHTAANVYTYVMGSALRRGRMVRHGYGGKTTAFAKSDIETVLAEAKAEFAVIMFGTNDSKEPADVQRSMQNLAHVIAACAKRGTVPVLATIPPRGYGLSQVGERHYNTQLIRLCRQGKVPISYLFDEIIRKELRQMLSDGVHLSSGPGNDAAGRALRKTFDQIYWALRDTSRPWR